MNTDSDHVQYDNLLLDDGELAEGILEGFPPADSTYNEPRWRRWFALIIREFSIAPPLFMHLLASTTILVCGAVFLIVDGPPDQECLVIRDSSANIYSTLDGDYVLRQTQQDEMYRVLHEEERRYQIEEGWVDKSTVHVEEITCPIDNY